MKEYYKAYNERYKTIHQKENSAWAGDRPSTVIEEFLKRNNISKTSPILEIGCGEGQNAIYLLKQGYNLTASDVSEEAVNWCKNEAKQNNLKENSFMVLDILDNNLKEKFDVILSVSTLHMLVKDEDRKGFFDFVYQHLNKNGIAYITVMGDGISERSSDIEKAFDITTRSFGDKSVEVVETSCRIVNWKTLTKEIANSNLKIRNKYLSTEISGFSSSMIIELFR